MRGYWDGSNSGPNNNATLNEYNEFDPTHCKISPSDTSFTSKNIPAVTNTTSCEDGWFAGWKHSCFQHSLDCIENMTVGDTPPMLSKIHQEYLAGAKAGNGTNSQCPMTGNAAFCQGWLSSNNFDDEGCSDDYPDSGPFSSNLIGCPLDAMNQSGMANHRFLMALGIISMRVRLKCLHLHYQAR